jgi:hypothetical protein
LAFFGGLDEVGRNEIVSGGAEDVVKFVGVAGFGGGRKSVDGLLGRIEVFAVVGGEDAGRKDEKSYEQGELAEEWAN